jgi:transcriptional regulator with XRE-family HTH domain
MEKYCDKFILKGLRMLGKRIKKAREYKGYSQDLLAEKIGKSKRTLLNYEQNSKEPTVSIAINIAKYCDISEIWLLTGKGEMLLNEQKSESVNKNFSNSGIITNGVNHGNINNGTPVKEEPKAVQKSADIEEMCAMMVQYAPREYVQQVRGKLEAFRELVGAG